MHYLDTYAATTRLPPGGGGGGGGTRMACTVAAIYLCLAVPLSVSFFFYRILLLNTDIPFKRTATSVFLAYQHFTNPL
ncbi:hypothetical protein ACJX0J_005769, partial [Zea mays]